VSASTEPMTDKRLAEIRKWVASGEADNSDAEALLAEVDRLRAELSQGDAWLDATPDGQCRRVTERIDGVSVTREVDRRPVLAGTEGDQ
jgi:hypothetical protein